MVKTERQIIFHGQHFLKFYLEQTEKVRDKIDYVFRIIKTVERVPEKFLKHLEGTDGLFEVRVEWSNNISRVFCCFDRDNLIVLFNAFQKKSQKTPKEELSLAIKLKAEYFSLTNREA